MLTEKEAKLVKDLLSRLTEKEKEKIIAFILELNKTK